MKVRSKRKGSARTAWSTAMRNGVLPKLVTPLLETREHGRSVERVRVYLSDGTYAEYML